MRYLVVSDNSVSGEHTKHVCGEELLSRYVESILLLGDVIAYVVPFTDDLAALYENSGQRIDGA